MAGVLAVFSTSALADVKTITIAGDPCSVPLITKLAEAYASKNKEFKAEVSSFSCTLGVYKAANGEADMGVSTQNGLGSNLPKGAVNKVVTKSPIVLIVNKANLVDNLSYEQVQGIFSGRIKNWKEVNGPDAEIKNVMLAPCVKHTISKQVVMYGEINQLTPGKKVNPVEYTNIMVAENEDAIGQQIYGYESKDVKVLRIDGVLPDENTMKSEYTFYQDFNVVTKGEPKGVVKEFINFAYSPEGMAVIKSMKHVPAK